MKIFILLILSSSTLFANSPSCPPGALSVEYFSAVTKGRKVTCGFMKNGVLIKHGNEYSYDKAGILLKTVSFNNGEENQPPAPIVEQPKGPTPQEIAEEKNALSVLQELLKVLAFDKSGINNGAFKVKTCDPKPKSWAIAAFTGTSISKSYVFNDHCDVTGNFTASFKEPFEVRFNLRNLQDYSSAQMTTLMKVTHSAEKIRYRFEVINGSMTAPSKSVSFKVEHEVDIDPVTGSARPSTQDGKITLTKIGNRAMNVVQPLIFKE
jgi:hypothetical protein